MIAADRLWICLKSCQNGISRARKISWTKSRDRCRVGSISENRIDITRRLVKNPGPGTTRVGREREVAVEKWSHRVWRIAMRVCRDRDFILVVVDAESAAHNDFVLPSHRRPRKTNRWAEIRFLWRVKVSSHANVQPVQRIRSRPE